MQCILIQIQSSFHIMSANTGHFKLQGLVASRCFSLYVYVISGPCISVWWLKMGLWSQTDLISNPSYASCWLFVLGQVNLSGLWFPHLWNGDDNCTGGVWGINEIIYVKSLVGHLSKDDICSPCILLTYFHSLLNITKMILMILKRVGVFSLFACLVSLFFCLE